MLAYDALYEEQIVLIAADSKEQVREKAITYARQEEHRYQNCLNKTVMVSFKLLLEVQSSLYKSETISTGTEVYSRFFRDYTAYEAFEPF